jgi:hypothetical protein
MGILLGAALLRKICGKAAEEQICDRSFVSLFDTICITRTWCWYGSLCYILELL